MTVREHQRKLNIFETRFKVIRINYLVIARAYTIMPMVWCIGYVSATRGIPQLDTNVAYSSVLGPVIGGALANPCKTFPNIFPTGTLWEQYPFLLPNLFSAFMVLVGVTVGLLFLDETHPDKKRQRDPCRDAGRRLAAFFQKNSSCNWRNTEKQALLEDNRLCGYDTTDSMSDSDEPLPRYQSHESSPLLAPQEDSEQMMDGEVLADSEPTPQVIFTKPVILNIVSYGILAL